MFTRSKTMPVPEVGAEAPEFNLPSAQGGQLRLSMRTVRGPVVVAFYRPWSEEDVAYFKELAAKEDEINLASGSVAAIGVAEPDAAREFARATGLKSYVLYDYAKVTSRQWGLLEREKGRGDYTRPAVFIVGPDGNVAHAWNDDRPDAAELLAKVSEISGLPKPVEEAKPEKAAESDEDSSAGDKAAPKKLTAEEREKIKAERRAAREAGKSLKTPQPEKTGETGADSGSAENGSAESAAPKKMSREERERIKAERRAARESGQSLKTPQAEQEGDASAVGAEVDSTESAGTEDGAPKKMSREERERIKAERRAAREAGQSLKTGGEAPKPEAADTSKPEAKDADAGGEQPRGTAETAEAAPASGSGTATDESASSEVGSETSEAETPEPAQAEGPKADPVEEDAAVGEKESPKKPDGKPVEE